MAAGHRVVPPGGGRPLQHQHPGAGGAAGPPRTPGDAETDDDDVDPSASSPSAARPSTGGHGGAPGLGGVSLVMRRAYAQN